MTTTSAEIRYLELLKRVLTRYDLGEERAAVVPSTPWKRRLWKPVADLIEARGFVLLRRTPQSLELREDGRDWPLDAETMVGLRRLDNVQACVEQALADGVEGDLLEAGVWRGGSAIFMRAVLAAHGDTDRRVWVADSFQGLPKPSAEHGADTGDLHWTQPYLAVSEDSVRRNFERYGLLDDRVHFLKGWFSDTLAGAPIERLAVLRADGDMYGSTMDILSALYPKVAVGGFVIIDDYGAVPGCKTAVDEYRATNGIDEPIVEIDWTGVYWRREH